MRDVCAAWIPAELITTVLVRNRVSHRSANPLIWTQTRGCWRGIKNNETFIPTQPDQTREEERRKGIFLIFFNFKQRQLNKYERWIINKNGHIVPQNLRARNR